MLPAFDNIVRLTDHGDSSFYGNPWAVGHLTNGMLVLYNFYEPRTKPFLSLQADLVDTKLSLWSLR